MLKSLEQQIAFLAMLSREIRAPMHRILGFARLLAAVCRVDQERDCARMIISNAEATLRIVDDALDFACMESGSFRMRAQPFVVRSLVEEVYCLLVPQAQQKGICIEQEIASDVPERLTGDARRLRQVLINLVSNAIKFTNEGYVAIRVSADHTHVFFSVENAHAGIPAWKMETIFDPFKSQDGLGLAISQRLVELMGGLLRVENEQGKGAKFFFNLPKNN